MLSLKKTRNKILILIIALVGIILAESYHLYKNTKALPGVFYILALELHKNGNDRFTTTLLKKSASMDPELSYWTAELANYYYLMGDKDQAIRVLEDCKKQVMARKHCIELENYYEDGNPPFELGFLKENIEEINSQAK